jgi:soluble lytic murein transglycosylase-like protein
MKATVALAGAMLAASFFATPAVAAEVFYSSDAEGILHFTNTPSEGVEPFRPTAPLQTGGGDSTPQPHGTGFDGLITAYAERFELEPALVKAVIRAESGFRSTAVSPKGARGLMQLMPETARRHGVANVYDPDENIRGGATHLRMLLDRHARNLPHALAAYNAGSGPVARSHGIPDYPETRDYVSRVLRFRREYQRQERLGKGDRFIFPASATGSENPGSAARGK